MSQEIGLAEGHLPHNERTVLYMGKTQLGLSSMRTGERNLVGN